MLYTILANEHCIGGCYYANHISKLDAGYPW